jgi:hypothetical protein
VIPVTANALVVGAMPNPFDQGDGDWFFHRLIPVSKFVSSPAGDSPLGAHTYRLDAFEMSSARKLQEDEQVVLLFSMSFLSGSNWPSTRVAWGIRSLLRQP